MPLSTFFKQFYLFSIVFKIINCDARFHQKKLLLSIHLLYQSSSKSTQTIERHIMKTTALQKIKSIIGAGLMAIACMYIMPTMAQQAYKSTATTTVIKGTSTLHDWDMKSATGQTQATFTVENGEITGITALTFTVGAETLKSSKSGLDKNAYKALNTGKHKTIIYKMTSGTVAKSGNAYTIKTNGTLTIA